jgi:hypothetical protein
MSPTSRRVPPGRPEDRHDDDGLLGRLHVHTPGANRGLERASPGGLPVRGVRLAVDLELVDVQAVHLEILDLELPDDGAADGEPSDRQGADGTGPESRRAHRHGADPRRADLGRSDRPDCWRGRAR